ncbi:uncharacterized protein LOC141661431 [Apium graveolens]|uniref:uncharacterized protein LOC141661431 n=1 Tax=Apium graveolens TaxID=4045 RepID=UPI003D7A1633
MGLRFLSRKRVIVIFERTNDSCFGDIKFLEMLKEMYLLWKGTCNEFEVIHSIHRRSESSRALGDLPWIVTDSKTLEYNMDRCFLLCNVIAMLRPLLNLIKGSSRNLFSDERIFKSISDDDDSIVKPSLHTLLAISSS